MGAINHRIAWRVGISIFILLHSALTIYLLKERYLPTSDDAARHEITRGEKAVSGERKAAPEAASQPELKSANPQNLKQRNNVKRAKVVPKSLPSTTLNPVSPNSDATGSYINESAIEATSVVGAATEVDIEVADDPHNDLSQATLEPDTRVDNPAALQDSQIVENSDPVPRPDNLQSQADQVASENISLPHPEPAMPEADTPVPEARPSISWTAPIEKSALVSAWTLLDSTYARFWPSRFKMAISYRGRLENPSGRNNAADSGDAYYLSRFRLEATFRVNSNIDLFAMAQDSRAFGYNNSSRRPAGYVDTFDLRQAYADIHGEESGGTYSLRVGRQYLSFGSKRLVGVGEWSNSPPAFDAARFTFSRSGMAVDIFAASRVSNINAYTMNESKKGENLYGTYFTFTSVVPDAKVEPYFFWRTQPRVIDESRPKETATS